MPKNINSVVLNGVTALAQVLPQNAHRKALIVSPPSASVGSVSIGGTDANQQLLQMTGGTGTVILTDELLGDRITQSIFASLSGAGIFVIAEVLGD